MPCKKKKKRRGKRYGPVGGIADVTGSLVGVSIGTNIGFRVADVAGHGMSEKVSPALRLMGVLPSVKMGGLVVKSVDMLGKPKKKRRRR